MRCSSIDKATAPPPASQLKTHRRQLSLALSYSILYQHFAAGKRMIAVRPESRTKIRATADVRYDQARHIE
jgi:hypothetical protein